MGKTYADAKNKYNNENYRQIKVCAPPEIAAEFKRACGSKNVSMSGEIIGFMKKYSESVAANPPPKKHSLFTRAGRRKKLHLLVSELEQIKAAEQEYQENIPENLQNSARYYAADECVSAIEEAVDLLNEAFEH